MEWCAGSPVKQIPYRQHVYSSEITRRRKALFQTENEYDNDSGLGPINLLYAFDACNNDDDDFSHCTESSFSFFRKVLEDVASRRNETSPVCDTTDEDKLDLSTTRTPLQLTSLNQFQTSSPKNITINETPVKDSPSKNFKTPDDVSNVNTVMPKLSRKLDTSINETHSNSRHTPDASMSKDSSGKSSKVRTTLFPDIVFPTKSFYPKTDKNCVNIVKTHIEPIRKVHKRKMPTVYLCRRGKKWNRVVKINGGVHHGIKKPKMKKKRDLVLKTVDNFDNSKLNEFLENLSRVKEPPQINRDNLKIVDVHKQVHTPDNEKENDQDLTSKNKIFKGRNVSTVNENKNVTKTETKHLDCFDLNESEEDVSLNNTVSNLIEILSNDVEKVQKVPEVQLQSVPVADDKNNLGASSNERKRKIPQGAVPENVEDILLSPTSQMCNMASCLAIRSPKRAKLNLKTLLDDGSNNSNDNVFNKVSSSPDMDKKMFPIFYPKSREDKMPATTKKAVEHVDKSPVRKWKALPKDQMILDAGQKRFGVTQCLECETIYHMGDPNEEIMHLNNHNAVNVLRFNVSIYKKYIHKYVKLPPKFPLAGPQPLPPHVFILE